MNIFTLKHDYPLKSAIISCKRFWNRREAVEAEIISRSYRFHSRSFQISHDRRNGWSSFKLFKVDLLFTYMFWIFIAYDLHLRSSNTPSLYTISIYDLYVRSPSTISLYNLYLRSVCTILYRRSKWRDFWVKSWKKGSKWSLLWNEINYNYFEYVDFNLY